MMGLLTKRIKRYCRNRFRLLNARICMRKMGFMLEDGLYCFNAESFRPAERGDRNPFRLIRIRTAHKYPKTYTEGNCYITSYHWTLVFDDYTYQTEKNRKRYARKSERIRQYWHRLPYPAMEVILDDDYCMYIYRTVHGKNYFTDGKQFDEDHFYDYLDLLFSSLVNADIQYETVRMKDTDHEAGYCVQHGDPYYKNVIWADEGPVIIDTDDVGYFPLFYDVFSFLFDSPHNSFFSNAYEFIRSADFQSRMKDICCKLAIEYSEDVTDLYLAARHYYYINRMNSNTRFENIDYHMHNYVHADLSGFPLASEAVEEYHVRLRKYGIEKTFMQELSWSAAKKVRKIKEKAWKFIEMRGAFKRISFFLEDGEYYYNQCRFGKADNHRMVNPLRKVRAESSEKHQTVYNHGTYNVRREHTVFTFDDMTCFIENNPVRYAEIKSRMEQNPEKLQSHAGIEFYDDKCIFVCRTADSINCLLEQESIAQQ